MHCNQINQNKKEIMKSIIITLGVCALLTGAAPLIGQEETNTNKPPEIKSEETKTIKATVEKINKDKREVTLKGESGKTVNRQGPETQGISARLKLATWSQPNTPNQLPYPSANQTNLPALPEGKP